MARVGPERADGWEAGLPVLLVGGLVGVGAIVMGAYANVTLLLTSTWLFWGVVRRETLGWWQTKRRKKGK